MAELFKGYFPASSPNLPVKSDLAGSDNQKILLQGTVWGVSCFFSMVITALQAACTEMKVIAISSLIVGIIVFLRNTKLRTQEANEL